MPPPGGEPLALSRHPRDNPLKYAQAGGYTMATATGSVSGVGSFLLKLSLYSAATVAAIVAVCSGLFWWTQDARDRSH
jgi:hypothetical protein